MSHKMIAIAVPMPTVARIPFVSSQGADFSEAPVFGALDTGFAVIGVITARPWRPLRGPALLWIGFDMRLVVMENIFVELD
jgi:hypothetical protein